ncbi:hypothetical protein HN873_061141, partial [Arachis hypogaea]
MVAQICISAPETWISVTSTCGPISLFKQKIICFRQRTESLKETQARSLPVFPDPNPFSFPFPNSKRLRPEIERNPFSPCHPHRARSLALAPPDHSQHHLHRTVRRRQLLLLRVLVSVAPEYLGSSPPILCSYVSVVVLFLPVQSSNHPCRRRQRRAPSPVTLFSAGGASAI